MTPTERGEVYDFLEGIIEGHDLDGLEVIVDALVTLASVEAVEQVNDESGVEWAGAADTLLNLYGRLADPSDDDDDDDDD